MTYKEDFLRFIFDYVKSGAKVTDVMETVGCNRFEAMNIYNKATTRFGRGPRKEKSVVQKNNEDERTLPTKFERPAAEYSAGYLHTLSKYS